MITFTITLTENTPGKVRIEVKTPNSTATPREAEVATEIQNLLLQLKGRKFTSEIVRPWTYHPNPKN